MKFTRISALAATMLAFATTAGATVETSQEWNFRVLLDGSEIGTHVFTLQEQQDGRLLRSEARFDVKFLFFTAYRYRHRNTEEWSNNCLEEIDATTVANGKEQEVDGELRDGAFVVEKSGEQQALPSCVMTFAYWNPEFLEQQRLLNPQTGDYVDVDIAKAGEETVTVRGEQVASKRYEVRAKDIELKVWYSQDDQWVALESTAKGGRILRYELI